MNKIGIDEGRKTHTCIGYRDGYRDYYRRSTGMQETNQVEKMLTREVEELRARTHQMEKTLK